MQFLSNTLLTAILMTMVVMEVSKTQHCILLERMEQFFPRITHTFQAILVLLVNAVKREKPEQLLKLKSQLAATLVMITQLSKLLCVNNH